MQDVFLLQQTTEVLQDDSYVASYPYLLKYFSSKTSFAPEDVVLGAHMAYGWMPTVLELYPEPGNDLVTAAELLTKAKAGSALTATELESLAALVNNSLVGASKLLHFVAPDHYAIWDSRVYSFFCEKRPHSYRVNNVETYKEYIKSLNDLRYRVEFPDFHKSVQKKLGYVVSPLRALELIMFLNAPVYGG